MDLNEQLTDALARKAYLALTLAAEAHKNQKRKYTDEPYIVHPISVLEILEPVIEGMDDLSDEEITNIACAACLHDVVEDTHITLDTIYQIFGETVSTYVNWLTDSDDGNNRVDRKTNYKKQIALAPPIVKTIKLADLIDNTKSIREHDPDFWKIYRKEKLELLEVLKEGDKTLWDQAMKQCEVE